MNYQRLNKDGVNGGGGEGVHPGDGVRRYGAVNQIILFQVALVTGHSLWIVFMFNREEEVVVSIQQDGDLTGVVPGR